LSLSAGSILKSAVCSRLGQEAFSSLRFVPTHGSEVSEAIILLPLVAVSYLMSAICHCPLDGGIARLGFVAEYCMGA